MNLSVTMCWIHKPASSRNWRDADSAAGSMAPLPPDTCTAYTSVSVSALLVLFVMCSVSVQFAVARGHCARTSV